MEERRGVLIYGRGDEGREEKENKNVFDLKEGRGWILMFSSKGGGEF